VRAIFKLQGGQGGAACSFSNTGDPKWTTELAVLRAFSPLSHYFQSLKILETTEQQLQS
jgi:hypothetical protein